MIDRSSQLSVSVVVVSVLLVSSCGGGGADNAGGGGGNPRFAYTANLASHSVSAYAINTGTGALTPIDADPATGGIQHYSAVSGPLCVAISPNGKFAYTANYGSNSISAFVINASTGTLTPVDADAGVAGIQNFTTGSLPKSVVIDPLGKYIYVASSGAGTVSIYAIDANTGALTDVGVPVAAGLSPAHMAITPSGAFAYVVNDNAVAGDVAAFAIDTATGVLTPIDADPNTSGIQNFVAGNASRSVTIHPSGKFAYVSNPGSLDVSAFAIDTATGVLTPIDADQGTAGIQNFAAGPAPYSIAFDATGSFAYVVYYGSHSVSAYSVNATTGALASTGMSVATGTYPWTITVDASGGFVYVTSYSSSDVSAYAINSTTGALTPIDADAVTAGIQNFPAGSGPVFIATGGP